MAFHMHNYILYENVPSQRTQGIALLLLEVSMMSDRSFLLQEQYLSHRAVVGLPVTRT
jgi:hypothetical protein